MPRTVEVVAEHVPDTQRAIAALLTILDLEDPVAHEYEDVVISESVS